MAGGAVVELRVSVPNRPGVVAEVALALGRASVNIVDMGLYPAADNASGVIAMRAPPPCPSKNLARALPKVPLQRLPRLRLLALVEQAGEVDVVGAVAVHHDGVAVEKRADVVYGSRFLGRHRVFLFTHYLGNRVLTLGIPALMRGFVARSRAEA